MSNLIPFFIITALLFLVVVILAFMVYSIQKKQQRTTLINQLIQSKLDIQEKIFSSISAEIHDNVGQLLSLAKVQMNIMDNGEILDRAILVEAKHNISQAITDLRDIAKSLSSDRIQFCSLVEMIQHELQRIKRLGIINTDLQTSGIDYPVSEQKKLILLRMIQESLQNILKHASAETITVYLDYFVDHLECKIVDDGVGFDLASIDRKNGLGLQNIINRAAVIGGKGHISSVINKGTSIHVVLPYFNNL